MNKLEYLEKIQSEYIQAELRVKMFKREKDKKYWSKIMSLKRIRIHDIQIQIGIPTILNEESEYKRVHALLIPEYGLPHFTYKGQDDPQRERDRKGYFRTFVTVDTKYGKGRIVATNLDLEVASVQFETGQRKWVAYSDIHRELIN